MASRPERTFTLLVATTVLAMLAGVALGRGVRSPAQQTLDVAPPPLSRLTAPVGKAPATVPVVARGTVHAGQQLDVGPVTSSAALSAVTAVPLKAGARVAAGDLLLEVSGRPVFLLGGSFPAYRDLRPGDSGPDVAQLNTGLRTLGLPAPQGDRFTPATRAALTSQYRKHGYQPAKDGGLDRREVVFAPQLPATLAQLTAVLGAPADKAALLQLRSGQTTVSAHVEPGVARTLRKGAAAALDLGGKAGPVAAEVSSVQLGASASTTTVVVQPSQPVTDLVDGQDVKLVLQQPVAAAGSLQVPVAALYSRTDGSTVVHVVRGGPSRAVVVRPGPAAGGMVTVTPDGDGLAVGDEVVVGS